MIAARSWLEVRRAAVEAAAVFVPFLVAFGVLALAMSVLIVANVVTGSVAGAVRRIGILKALDFTPGEVVRAHVGQALLPATVGAGAGVIVGNLLAVPLLGRVQVVYGTPKLALSWWVDVVVVVFVLGLVAGTGWLAALRAGRLSAVDALAMGRNSSGELFAQLGVLQQVYVLLRLVPWLVGVVRSRNHCLLSSTRVSCAPLSSLSQPSPPWRPVWSRM